MDNSRTKPVIKHQLGEAASAYLDVLRALASNLVIAAHVLLLYFHVKDPYSLGNLGVAIFFLLSGFLITQSMLNWSHKPGPQLPGFLADRVARIFTPYVPALILIVGANVLLIRNYAGSEDSNTGLLTFLGNLLMLQDHSVFQLLELVGVDVAWRIRSYNAAEPFWTVAIEMWIYVAMGLFFFCLIKRERIDRRYLIALALVSFPVIVWNAAAGGGKSLTLIWLLGSVAGYLFYLLRDTTHVANVRLIGYVLALFGTIALVGRIGKVGLQPYDVQSAALMGMILFGVLARLMCVQSMPRLLQRVATFLASYSYSLYLIHNTVLIIAVEWLEFDNLWVEIVCGVLLAHLAAYGLYIAFERHYRSVARWLRPTFERAMAAHAVSTPARPDGTTAEAPVPLTRVKEA
jgi:peptidoglycan/LPS O-acetylase OafA/YrhL